MAGVLMYTTPWCGYCSAARELLRSKNVDFEEIDVSMDSKLRAEMVEKTNRTSVPQIFINEQHIGGYSDMAELEQKDELQSLLDTDNSTP
jgi:glutaredoxin 3